MDSNNIMRPETRAQESPGNEMDISRNIWFVINSTFPAYSGGRETWLYNVTKQLSRMGYNVTIVSLADHVRPVHFKDLSVFARVIRCANPVGIPFLRRVFRSYAVVLGSFIQAFTMGVTLRRAFGRFGGDEDVFIAMDTLFTPIAIRFLRRKIPNIKYILSVRGRHAEELSRRFPLLTKLFYKMERHALQDAPVIWANGHDTVGWLKELGYASILVPNGIDVAHIRTAKPITTESLFTGDSFRIVSIGTLRDVKGIRELLEAGAYLIEGGMTDLELVFVGKGNADRFKRIAKELQIEKHVHFVGEKYDVIPYLKACHVAACLSEGGGMSMAALESLASGIPVIAWDTLVYQQLIINGTTGKLVPLKDAHALAEGIREIRENYSEWKQRGCEAAKTIEQYDWENISKRIVQLIGGS